MFGISGVLHKLKYKTSVQDNMPCGYGIGIKINPKYS